MKQERRWMKSILAAANAPQVALPWARGARRRPAALTMAALKPVEPAKAPAAAAR